MAKYLFSVRLSTGNQAFATKEEYVSFLDGLNTPDSPIDLMWKYNESLKSSGNLILQDHHLVVQDDTNDFVISKIFNDQSDATSYNTWMTEGEGKTLLDAWMQPIGWKIEDIMHRELGDEEFTGIMASI